MRGDVELGRNGRSLALALAVFTLTWLCLAFSHEFGRVAVVWLPNAVQLAFVLDRRGRPAWDLLAIGFTANLAANVVTGDAAGLGAGLAFANSVEVWLCAKLMRGLSRDEFDPASPRDLMILAGAAATAAAVSALVAASLLHFSGRADPVITFLVWWAADALGLAMFLPCGLIALHAPRHLREAGLRPRGAACLALFAGVTTVVFWQSSLPLLFLIPPVFLLLSVEMELLGVAAGSVLLFVAAAVALTLNTGPGALVAADEALKSLLSQGFIAVSSISALVNAAFQVQRRRLAQSLMEARDEAREQARRATMAEEVAGVAHWRLDLDTQRLDWSHRMFEIFGVPGPVTPERAAVAAMIHPDDKEAFRVDLAGIVRGDDPPEETCWRAVRPSGEVRHARGRWVHEYDAEGRRVAVFGTVVDVTRQRESELEVAASEARYRLLAENVNDTIFRVSREGECLYVSQAIERQVGYTAAEFLAMPGFPLLHPEDRPAFEQAMGQIFAGNEGVSIEFRARHRDGHWVWLQGKPRPIHDSGGAVVEIIDVIRDVTRRKEMEEGLRVARREAEDAAAVKSEFLANMSHELRTPLTAILGFSTMLSARPGLDETARRCVARVASAGAALLTIVNDLLDFSKLESGMVPIKPVPVAVGRLAEEALDLFGEQAGSKPVALRLALAPTLPPMVQVDPDRLRQVLLNLISNAVKFTDAGEVALEVGYTAPGTLEIAVADTGPGVPKADLDRLFQRFSQIDGTSTRTHKGTGLGLAICKGLVQAMGGEIGVDSERGVGSRFWFRIPAPAVQVVGADEADEPADRPDAGVRILVVDDHAANRELVRAMLQPFDTTLEDARDGAQAIELASRQPFDLILMDMRMPGMDGAQAAAQIRAGDGPNRTVPILAFSADGLSDAPQSIFDGTLAKPLIAGELISAVRFWTKPDQPGGSPRDAEAA